MIHAYGRKFVHHDSGLALAYYMLAAAVRGGSVAVKGQVRALLLIDHSFDSVWWGLHFVRVFSAYLREAFFFMA